jgi:hypothetical protein
LHYYPNVCQELLTNYFQSAVTTGCHLQTFEVQRTPDWWKPGQKDVFAHTGLFVCVRA